MPILAAILATLLGGIAGYNINSDTQTCDAAEIAFRADYAEGHTLLGAEQDPGHRGYAMVYGNPQTGPDLLHIYIIAGAEDHIGDLKLQPLGVCVSGAGQTFSHYAVTELPKRAPQKTSMPDL